MTCIEFIDLLFRNRFGYAAGMISVICILSCMVLLVATDPAEES